MSTRPLRFGVIGLGGIGAAHAAFLTQLEETCLVAVADTNAAQVQRIAEETGAQAFVDYRQLLGQGELDAVVIATPHPLHEEMTCAAAEHRLHVMCEKPLADSTGAADRMLAACREAGVLLGTMFQQRADPSRQAMKRLMDEKVLGPLHRVAMSVTLYRPQAYYDSAPWRGTWKGEGGGILMQAAHALDQLAWLVGIPRRVQALTLTRLHEIETENTAIALLDYGGEMAGWFHISTADALNSERLEVSGDCGALVWEDGRLRHLRVPVPMSCHLQSAKEMFSPLGGEWRDIAIAAGPQPHRELLRAFAIAVRTGDASRMIASGEDGLRSLELSNALLLSGQSRREVSLPLDRARYERLLRALQLGEPAKVG